MTTFQRKLQKERLSMSNNDTEDVDLEEHFRDQLEFRESIINSPYGEITCIMEIDNTTYLQLDDNLPFDSLNLTKDAKERITNVENEKIAIFIKDKTTDAIFVKLCDKPETDSWDKSEIRDILYSEGVTADSLDEIIGKQMPLNLPMEENEESNQSLNKEDKISYTVNTTLILFMTGMLILGIDVESMSIVTTLIMTTPIILYVFGLVVSTYRVTKRGD
jgi:hypothetical protein